VSLEYHGHSFRIHFSFVTVLDSHQSIYSGTKILRNHELAYARQTAAGLCSISRISLYTRERL